MSSDSLASEYVTDTMGLVLRLEGRQMGAQAQTIFAAAEAGQTVIHIPAMVMAEILYLSEKAASLLRWLMSHSACKPFRITVNARGTAP